jgi:hypothetical protein
MPQLRLEYYHMGILLNGETVQIGWMNGRLLQIQSKCAHPCFTHGTQCIAKRTRGQIARRQEAVLWRIERAGTRSPRGALSGVPAGAVRVVFGDNNGMSGLAPRADVPERATNVS